MKKLSNAKSCVQCGRLKKRIFQLERECDARLADMQRRLNHEAEESNRKVALIEEEVEERVALEVRGYREYMQGRMDERDQMLKQMMTDRAVSPFKKALVNSRKSTPKTKGAE